jgi:hypothetical protein
MKFKFYQVRPTTDGGNSAEMSYFTNKAEAEKYAAEWRRDNPDEQATVYVVEVAPTKGGILRALKVYASHADNG